MNKADRQAIQQGVAEMRERFGDATLLVLKLENKALRAFPSSPKQKELRRQIDELYREHPEKCS